MFPQGLYNMPIPGMDRKDILFNSRAYWKLRFLWRPRRSAITGRWLWLRYVYEGTAMWAGLHEAVVEFRYHEPVEHIIWKLKQ